MHLASFFPGFFVFSSVQELGMIPGWENTFVWMTRIGSLDFVHSPRSEAFSVIPRLEWCACSAGEKNGLRRLRARSSGLLRSQDSPGTRPLLRRHEGLPGGGGPAGRPEVLRCREAGD